MSPALASILIGLCFGVWPLLARKGAVGPGWTNLILCSASMVTAALFGFYRNENAPRVGGGWVVLGGVVNACASLAYVAMLSTPGIQVSLVVPVALIVTIAVSVLGGALLYGEALSTERCIGLALGLTAIFLMKK